MLEGKLEIAQADQVLETPVYVNFVYRNASKHPISFSIGNGRDDSYRFQTVPETIQHDPYYDFGGLAPIFSLKPGESGVIEILLNRYLQFQKPGQVTLHFELDVDVTDDTSNERRNCEIRSQLELTLHEDEKRRQQILEALEADLHGRDGEKQFRAADALSELRSDHAVPVLKRGLKSSNSAVLELMKAGLERNLPELHE